MAMQFQGIIALPSHIKISVCSTSCAGNAYYPLKLSIAENLKTLDILAIFLSASIVSAHREAVFKFFLCSGNDMIFNLRFKIFRVVVALAPSH